MIDLLDGKYCKRFRDIKYWDLYEDNNYWHYELHPHEEKVLETLKGISDMFSLCKLKSLLLPRIGGFKSPINHLVDDEYMLHRDMLQNLVEYHPEDSCLILQSTERPNSIDFLRKSM